MCSRFEIVTSDHQISEALQLDLPNITGVSQWNQQVTLSQQAPLVEVLKGKVTLSLGTFPVAPFPNSRLSDMVINSINEEEEHLRIYDRPTWKRGFASERCLIPMTRFFEPAYWGDNAGAWVAFQTNEPLMFAAGIRIQPKKPFTTGRTGFSILTHTASDQMLKYHHRLIVLLKPEDGLTWLRSDNNGKSDPKEKLSFLEKHRWVPDFIVSEDKKMAKGWEKRTETHIESLKEEMAYRAKLKALV